MSNADFKMILFPEFLKVFVCVSLLRGPAASVMGVPQLSLWGKVVDFRTAHSHWKLKPHVSVPPLQELTVCLSLNFKTEASSPWTAFVYRHPEVQHAVLGLGGKQGVVVVWLFGVEWSARVSLRASRWYSLCLTWSHERDGPALYIDGQQRDMRAAYSVSTPTSCRNLRPNGTLTLGVSHILNDGIMQIIPFSGLLGKMSQFRLWRREHSRQDMVWGTCAEGDVLKWERDNWDTLMGTELTDPSLTCEWSYYEVRLVFSIIRNDEYVTEVYTARDVAHQWLRDVLPDGIYLHRVSVFEMSRQKTEDGRNLQAYRISRSIKSFQCLVHISVIPSRDVADVQSELQMYLSQPYTDSSGQLEVLAEGTSIYTTPVESFSSDATIPPPDGFTATTTPAALPTTTTPGTSTGTSTSTITSTSTMTSTKTSTSTSAATEMTTVIPADISDVYFEVKANVSITGDCDVEQTLSTWLVSSLPVDTMKVLSLHLLPRYDPVMQLNTSDRDSVYKVSRASCVFQVQVLGSLSYPHEIAEQIRNLLLVPYHSGSVSVMAEDIKISRILILKCQAETRHTRKGVFRWPATLGGENATRPCPKNSRYNATRLCKLCISTHWIRPDLQDCAPVVETIPDLDHVTVTSDNALDVVEMVQSLVHEHSTISYQELVTVLNKLEDIVNVSTVTPHLGQALVDTISDILESDSDLPPFTNTILNITEAVGAKMVGYNGSYSLVAPSLAISVVDVDPDHFGTLTFGVSSNREGSKPEISINKRPFNSTVAFISLPPALQHCFPQTNQSKPRVQFQFFGFPMLFKRKLNGPALDSFVVSASVTNASAPIQDLNQDVKVKLHHLLSGPPRRDVQCAYWNFNKNDGHGGWDDHGCRTFNSSSEYTTCLCDHLTHFGVLLDVTRTPLDPIHERILTIITYVGCGLSSLFLGITVLTYTIFEKLRRDYPSQILINLCLALLGLNLVFLLNSWLSSWAVYGLCVATAAAMHYFLLASFTWMGLEAVNMYFALVKVFNVYVPSYILKFCALGWGFPLLICILVLVVKRDAYGSQIYSDGQQVLQIMEESDFCWLQDNVTYYVSVVAYAVLIFLFNSAVFVVVLIQIRHMRANRPAGIRGGIMQDLKGVASLTLLLGLTWAVGFFALGPAKTVLVYLFAGLNTLQGLFIFFFHCLMKENVRKQWRIHLCFGRFRLDEYSEWSNTASAGVAAKPKPNPNPPGASVPSVRSVKSSSTESTSASSDSSQRDSSCKRPNLCLFVDSVALPRAKRSPPGAGAPTPHREVNLAPGWRSSLLHQDGQR